jgi:NTE family protein
MLQNITRRLNTNAKILEHSRNNHFNSLVFSGGSTKGISYCGALKILERENILPHIKNYAGTSAGSIVAALSSIGYTPTELTRIMMNIDMEKFFDDKLGFIRDTINFMKDWGICEGEYACNLLNVLIENKVGKKDYTIQELYDEHKITLVIVGTNLNKKDSIYFYPNSEHSDISICKAVRISMGFPFIYEPVIYKNYLCDGGVLDNYPIHVFDGEYPGDVRARYGCIEPNPNVLGLHLKVHETELHKKKEEYITSCSCCEFAMSYIETFLADNERRNNIQKYDSRTIDIFTPYYSSTDFNINNKDKEILIKCGMKYVNKYFENQK